MSSGPVLTVLIKGVTEGLDKALGDSSQSVKGFGSALGSLAGPLAIAGGVAVAGAAIVDMTKAAADDAAEQDRLAKAIEASGAATGDWVATTEAAIAAGQKKAFTDTQIRDAMVPLVGATGDVEEATALLGTAQDIARLKGIDLATAAEAVAKAEAGNASPLARMIGLTTEGATAQDILTQAQARAEGQAEAYGATTAGSMEAASIAFSEVGETIGSAFLPVLEELLPVIIPLIEQIAELVKKLLPVLIPLLKLSVIPLKLLAKAISAVLDFLGPLIDGLAQAIDLFSDFIGGADAAKGAEGPGAGGGGRAVMVTINTGADPDAVIRAVRKYAANNGGSMGALRAWG